MAETPARICGLVLAAGAGTRFGGPKALARAADGTPWVALAVRMLRDAGCADVLVVLGAAAPEASLLVPGDARVVVAGDWHEGLGASLRAGLHGALDHAALTGAVPDAVLVTPVDTPDASPHAARRVIERGVAVSSAETSLARAVYAGAPGHPVLIGRDHWAGLSHTLSGDSGAGRYLRAHGAQEIECGDLWSGADIDRRPV